MNPAAARGRIIMLVKEFFSDAELKCKCGCGLMPSAGSVERLYALRILYGKPMTVTSAARCKAHNAKVKGASGSTHVPAKDRAGVSSGWGGQGFDIRVSGVRELVEIARLALSCGFRGIGIAETFIHIDDAARPDVTFWDY
jgi:uncharacterized protein YcbK (DUF882 family)